MAISLVRLESRGPAKVMQMKTTLDKTKDPVQARVKKYSAP